MFAHCLLPALLLLFTIDYCNALRSPVYPPIVTNSSEGTLVGVFSYREEKFELRNEQCYGVLIPSTRKALQCTPPGAVGLQAYWINVTVYDTDKIEIRRLALDHVMVVRKAPCPDNLAIVDVQIGCGRT